MWLPWNGVLTRTQLVETFSKVSGAIYYQFYKNKVALKKQIFRRWKIRGKLGKGKEA